MAIILLFQGGMLLEGDDPKKEIIRLGESLALEVHGWKAKGKDKLYNPKTIFDYIDGAGEVYRSYNFHHLLVRRYAREGKPDIVADVFDMGTSEDAFGVFTHDLEGEEAGIGQGSTYKGGLLSFWKARFFISLYAEEETDETREALLALGREVDASIEEEGERPVLISLLPQEGLEEKSIRYFHNHIILNYHYFVADNNILLLDQKTEAALGKYGEGNIRFLIIRYPNSKKASDAYKTFIEYYMPDAKEAGMVQTEDRKWTAVRIKEEYIFIVFDAPSVPYAKELMESVERRIGKS